MKNNSKQYVSIITIKITTNSIDIFITVTVFGILSS